MLPDSAYYGGNWHYGRETTPLAVVENALERALLDLERFAQPTHPLTMTPAAIRDALARLDDIAWEAAS